MLVREVSDRAAGPVLWAAGEAFDLGGVYVDWPDYSPDFVDRAQVSARVRANIPGGATLVVILELVGRSGGVAGVISSQQSTIAAPGGSVDLTVASRDVAATSIGARLRVECDQNGAGYLSHFRKVVARSAAPGAS